MGRGARLQSDGRIVAAGADLAFAIVRYDVNGSLDTGFSGDGIVTDPAGNGADALAIRGDGKILAAGSGWGDFTLLRVTSDGSIDTSFSTDGKVITDFNQTHDYATAIALQSDGKVVAAGASGKLRRRNSAAISGSHAISPMEHHLHQHHL